MDLRDDASACGSNRSLAASHWLIRSLLCLLRGHYAGESGVPVQGNLGVTVLPRTGLVIGKILLIETSHARHDSPKIPSRYLFKGSASLYRDF